MNQCPGIRILPAALRFAQYILYMNTKAFFRQNMKFDLFNVGGI